MTKNRGIGHWRHIDQDKLAQRVKGLPLGSEEETITSEIIGPAWMKRVDVATKNLRRSNTARWEAIQEEREQEKVHNEKISNEIEKRRESGHPFGV